MEVHNMEESLKGCSGSTYNPNSVHSSEPEAMSSNSSDTEATNADERKWKDVIDVKSENSPFDRSLQYRDGNKNFLFCRNIETCERIINHEQDPLEDQKHEVGFVGNRVAERKLLDSDAKNAFFEDHTVLRHRIMNQSLEALTHEEEETGILPEGADQSVEDKDLILVEAKRPPYPCVKQLWSRFKDVFRTVTVDNTQIRSDDTSVTSSLVPPRVAKTENSFDIFIQIVFPFLVAGIGTVSAGWLLAQVQYWTVFRSISELFILVPALCGLKGNLEMTLASRLSTAANLGAMDTRSGIVTMCYGNFLITQLQSVVTGLLASFMACGLAFLQTKELLSPGHFAVLCTAGVTTAVLANLILTVLVMAVIIVSRRLKINPDNIATPIAASLGDLVTIALLAGSGTLYLKYLETFFWVQMASIFFMFALIPFLALLCYRDASVREVLVHGWTPIIIAMIISSMAGLILDSAQRSFVTFAAFSPVINGIGGNLVAVQASRVCTFMHANCARGRLRHYQTLGEDEEASEEEHKSEQSWIDVNRRLLGAFAVKSNPHAKSALVLLSLVVPGDIFFVLLQSLVSKMDLPTEFFLMFCLVSLFQVFILLLLADWIVHVLWKLGKDPDNCSIPYLTAFSDLSGTGFLLMGYLVLNRD